MAVKVNLLQQIQIMAMLESNADSYSEKTWTQLVSASLPNTADEFAQLNPITNDSRSRMNMAIIITNLSGGLARDVTAPPETKRRPHITGDACQKA